MAEISPGDMVYFYGNEDTEEDFGFVDFIWSSGNEYTLEIVHHNPGGLPFIFYADEVTQDTFTVIEPPQKPFEPGYFLCNDSTGSYRTGDVVKWAVRPPEGYWSRINLILDEEAVQ